MESLLQVVLCAVGIVYLNKDAIIENVKSKVMESVMPDGLGDLGLPSTEGTSAPLPSGVGLGIPSF